MRVGFDAPPTSIKASQLAEYYGLRWIHVRLLTTVGMCVAVQAAMLGSTPYMLGAVTDEFDVSDEAAPLVMSIVFVGSILGVFLGGRLSDMIGRRSAMILSVMTVMVVGFTQVFVPHRNGFMVLLLIRLILGIPYGSILAIQAPMIMEFFPDYARGTAAALSGIGWNVGNLFLLAFIPVQGYKTAYWRSYFAIGPVVPSVLAMVMLHLLPESPRWLLTQGRTKEAENSLSDILTSMPIMGTAPVGQAPHIDTTELDKLGTSSLAQLSTAKSIELLFSSSLWWPTVALSLLYFLFAGPSNVAWTWGPQILEAIMRKDPGSDLYIVAEYFGVAGTLAAMALIDQVPRRGLLTLSFAFLGTCFTWLVIAGLNYNSVLVAWSLRSFFDCLLWGAITVFLSEAFPTLLRGTGSGVVMVGGRASSVFLPILAGVYITGSVNVILAAIAISCFVCFSLTMTISREFTGQPMDDGVSLDDAASMPLTSSTSTANSP